MYIYIYLNMMLHYVVFCSAILYVIESRAQAVNQAPVLFGTAEETQQK